MIDVVKATLVDKVWPLLTGVRVLVVMDGSPSELHYATFGPGDPSTDPLSGDQYFGLSEFLRTLTHSKFATFLVTKAHRDTDVAGHADIEHFRFDGAGVDLSIYDEILLFGLAPADEALSPMSDSELAALAAFMDGGGGVFATGDHEDLGVALCGRVPRVRSMRKWYYPDAGPLGEPVAPPAIGVDRIETTQRGMGESFTHFDDQSDDIPQPIEPRMYVWRSGILSSDLYPHPLLCGPHGPIKVLPDHMHEGEVIEPWDTSATLTFGSHQVVEYPADSHGHQVKPEIVAWGKVVGETDISTEGAHVGDPGHVANARSFGVVGAYDGHQLGVGRVAVDSTWHHFFDINLIGDPVAPFPKTEGFKSSADGLAALADIEVYYQNIATWLARPRAIRGLFAAAAWYAARSQPLAMLVNGSRRYTLEDTIGIGDLARESLLRFLPPCTLTHVTWRELVDGPVRVPLWDPWRPGPGNGDPGPIIDPMLVVKTMLGGAVIAIARDRRRHAELEPEQVAVAVREAASAGAHDGIRQLGGEIARHAERLERVAHGLAAAKDAARH